MQSGKKERMMIGPSFHAPAEKALFEQIDASRRV